MVDFSSVVCHLLVFYNNLQLVVRFTCYVVQKYFSNKKEVKQTTSLLYFGK